MADCTSSSLLSDARCFTCIQPNHLEAIKVYLLCQILQFYNPAMNCDVNALMAASTYFTCLEPRQQAAIQTNLLCEILNAAGGGTGTSGVTCAAVDPTVDPGVNCQLYYNTATSTLWSWNDPTTAWVALII